jgi:putative FmdB family regulatory protein
MPIYEYWCQECKISFEKLRAMDSKDSDVACPRCSSAVKRMVSVFAVSSRSGGGGEQYPTGGGCGCGAGGCGCGRRN